MLLNKTTSILAHSLKRLRRNPLETAGVRAEEDIGGMQKFSIAFGILDDCEPKIHAGRGNMQ